MLGLGENTAPPAGDLIKDGTEAGFMADVIEMSRTVPVIVDFWATWCGPCKTLGPALEAAVIAAKGKVKMVKIDVDQNQGLAGQMRIQSIPTVYGFWDGKPVDAFQGALPGSEIKAFVDKQHRLTADPTVMLGQDDFYGQVEIEAHWRNGFPEAQKVSGSLLK